MVKGVKNRWVCVGLITSAVAFCAGCSASPATETPSPTATLRPTALPTPTQVNEDGLGEMIGQKVQDSSNQ